MRRLKTDYIDLYWLHVWDMVTPVEEVLQSLGDLVRAGKIRYFGFSDVPAWYAVKAAVLAAQANIPGPIAMQLAYSLVERNIEREHVPAARECGFGITPWSPLAAGFLAGKYRPTEGGVSGEGRLSGPNPFGTSLFTQRNWQILATLQKMADEIHLTPAKIALAWAASQPEMTSLIIGARGLAQLHHNFEALEVELTKDQLNTLNSCSALEPSFPYALFTEDMRRSIFGGKFVTAWR